MLMIRISALAILSFAFIAGCASARHVDTQPTPDGKAACQAQHTSKVRMYKGTKPQIITETKLSCDCKPGNIGFFGFGTTEHQCCTMCSTMPDDCTVCAQHPQASPAGQS